MSLFNALVRLMFGSSPRPSSGGLRNRPGGMAIVVRIPAHAHLDGLDGCYVRTVQLTSCGSWRIHPPLRATVTRERFSRHAGRKLRIGETVLFTGLEDEYLDPVFDTGVSDEEVVELYAPRKRNGESSHV